MKRRTIGVWIAILLLGVTTGTVALAQEPGGPPVAPPEAITVTMPLTAPQSVAITVPAAIPVHITLTVETDPLSQQIATGVATAISPALAGPESLAEAVIQGLEPYLFTSATLSTMVAGAVERSVSAFGDNMAGLDDTLATISRTVDTLSDTVAGIAPVPPTTTVVEGTLQTVLSRLQGETVVLFGWHTTEDWGTGWLYFVLGMAGALVTVYLFLGEFLPSMGGKANLARDEIVLEEYQAVRRSISEIRQRAALGHPDGVKEEQLRAAEALSDDLDNMIIFLERRIRSERWRLFALGFPMYVILGGFFAMAMAGNFLEAIVIGFGWTVVADRLGLERETAVRKEIRDTEISKIETQRREMAREVEELKGKLVKAIEERDKALEIEKEMEGVLEFVNQKKQGAQEALQTLRGALQDLPLTDEQQALLDALQRALQN